MTHIAPRAAPDRMSRSGPSNDPVRSDVALEPYSRVRHRRFKSTICFSPGEGAGPVLRPRLRSVSGTAITGSQAPFGRSRSRPEPAVWANLGLSGSPMRFRGDHLAMRLSGTLVGVGFLLLGTFAVIGPGVPISEENQDKAFWFGMHLIVGGVLAVFGSWTARNLDGIWCRHPRRWGSSGRDDR